MRTAYEARLADVESGLHMQIVIFVKSVQRARELNKLLVECNFPSIAIHGSMTQTERLEVRRWTELTGCCSIAA